MNRPPGPECPLLPLSARMGEREHTLCSFVDELIAAGDEHLSVLSRGRIAVRLNHAVGSARIFSASACLLLPVLI
jgi:hypothetical protein